MTIWIFDVMWTLMLFGVALFTGCCIVFNPAIRGIRTMGILSSYAVGIWMLIVLPARIAIGTWCVFASAGGMIALAYELWARRRYAAAGRKPRPLILLQGFILWPGMIPDAIVGVLVDTGILEPSGPREANSSTKTAA